MMLKCDVTVATSVVCTESVVMCERVQSFVFNLTFLHFFRMWARSLSLYLSSPRDCYSLEMIQSMTYMLRGQMDGWMAYVTAVSFSPSSSFSCIFKGSQIYLFMICIFDLTKIVHPVLQQTSTFIGGWGKYEEYTGMWPLSGCLCMTMDKPCNSGPLQRPDLQSLADCKRYVMCSATKHGTGSAVQAMLKQSSYMRLEVMVRVGLCFITTRYPCNTKHICYFDIFSHICV